VHHHPKFNQNQLNGCGYMAIFQFFKMEADRHLGFVGHILEHPLRVLGGLYHLSKFSWNGIHSVVFITWKFEYFTHLAGKSLFMPPKLIFLGDNLTP